MKDSEKGEQISGLPAMAIFPAMDYKLILGKKDYTLTVPKRGKYEDLMASDDTEGRSMFSGEFVVYDDDTGVFYPPVFTSVLLAMQEYPDIQSNSESFDVFSIKAVIPYGDEVQVVGELVSILTE